MPKEDFGSDERWINSSEGKLRIITPDQFGSEEIKKGIAEASEKKAKEWSVHMKEIRENILCHDS